ncbi:MAG: hypothetical protein M1834_004359 [Cirrosporium novae-zelandiae]|nr:MAG: hypothetical protein M1834_004359 [Cirrosporium novae-zelandiae]
MALDSLNSYFQPPRPSYTDEDVEQIRIRLPATETLTKYSVAPRLYIVLRVPDQLVDFDHFQSSDRFFPFSPTQLPAVFTEGWKHRFLKVQPVLHYSVLMSIHTILITAYQEA